ncbi:unnamed protein product [Plutella xylostella]|uniref:(diamondback moth) hypothetical protein n=1 Tax=Plutella xylostella TaxID=51655 RepID=A0A8S4DWD8_PLUXY|nr:unnamed protein product [Plutella xylostella]
MWSRGAAAAELATPPLGEEALRPPASCKPHHNSSSEASVSMDQTNSDDDPCEELSTSGEEAGPTPRKQAKHPEQEWLREGEELAKKECATLKSCQKRSKPRAGSSGSASSGAEELLRPRKKKLYKKRHKPGKTRHFHSSLPNLKQSKVAPIYKGKGRRDDLDKYRPVSVVPATSKIFENGISTRLTSFLSSSSALSPRQYAYREGHSTAQLVREVVGRVLRARDARLQVAVLCCDLSKAFDVADHDVIAAKLRHYGIGGMTLALLSDFLRNRSQVVVGDKGKTRSDPLSTTIGVAQGSSVSNILFSLLLNDLPDAVSGGEVFMYADDVAAVATAPTVEGLKVQLNVTASQLAQWFRLNGLVLNIEKTHFLHFDLSGRPPKPIHVVVGNSNIDQVDVTTFLGFEMDRKLTWGPHIDKMCGRLGGACFALRRVARALPREAARACYFATAVHSVLQYGTELWGRAADWERAFRMQKRAIRALAGVSWDTSAKPHFRSLEILTLPSVLILQIALYVRQNLPTYKKHSDAHGYATRGADRLAELPRRLAKFSKTTRIAGPAVYNSLPNDVTSATNIHSAAQLKTAELAESVSEVEEESSGSDTAHCQLLCDNVDARYTTNHVT